MSGRNCSTCFHMGTVEVPMPPQTEGGELPPPRLVEVCRHDTPKATLIPTPDRGVQVITLWPQVVPEKDVCGVWLTKDHVFS